MFDKGYKGSNLALMVELLAGPLVGAAVADKLSEKNWGNLVVALDPGLLGDKEVIKQRMQMVLDRWEEGGRTRERGREREGRYQQGEDGRATYWWRWIICLMGNKEVIK